MAMVIGVTIFAYFMASTANLITAMNTTETVVHQRIMQVSEFLRHRHVPKPLSEKIKKFHSLVAQQQIIDNESIVNQLSMPLRTELLLFLYRGTLEKVPFFKVRTETPSTAPPSPPQKKRSCQVCLASDMSVGSLVLLLLLFTGVVVLPKRAKTRSSSRPLCPNSVWSTRQRATLSMRATWAA